MKRTLWILVCLLVLTCVAWAQDSQDSQPAQPTQDAQETVTIPKSDLDKLNTRIDEMERELQEIKAQQAPGQPAEQSDSSKPATEAAPTAPNAGGKFLALPDISLVVQALGKLSTDKRDTQRSRIRLTEAEIGIQGYVYPNVKADAFITTSPSEGAAAAVEEAYLTYQGIGKGLNLFVGKKHVPFGRTNLLHNHSWLYARQPLVIKNFVASESLGGEGADIGYVIPTGSNLFAQLDLGTWSAGDAGEETNLPDIMVGPGANLTNRFNTARLWTGYPVTENSELELGGSWADGRSEIDPISSLPDRVRLTGVDLTYRQFGQGTKRLLLRGESFWRSGSTDASGAMAEGYYLFGNYRWDNYGSLGLLYDWSEFPQAPGLHESAISAILTRQFSEQYYLRLQATHGSRPDAGHYDELWLQWVWGVGPHTHNLE